MTKFTFQLILFCFFPVLTAAKAASSYIPPLISVRGEGTVTAAPDTATIKVGVSSEGKTARLALTQNNHDMERILNEMKAVGIQDRDLQTSGFRLSPKYNYKKDPPQVTGYQASNDLTIRIRDIESTGNIMDKAVSLGINNILDNIQFTKSDPKEILQEARRQAVKDAKEKAETIVGELGVGLGGVYSISEESHHQQERQIGRPKMAARTMAMEQSSVPIASGETSFRVAVDISWEIDPNNGESCSGA